MDTSESDIPIFVEYQCDPVAARIAAFGAKERDREALAARWKKGLHDESTTRRAIVVGPTVVGLVASFMREGQLEVTYWIGRAHWGRGIAHRCALAAAAKRHQAFIYARGDRQRRIASGAR